MTNSITNSAYFSAEELGTTVKMLNNLSAELNVLRPSMLETGLEAIAYNLNRKNNDLRFFEFGKTYGVSQPGHYSEREHLCIYISGTNGEESWRSKPANSDFYVLKGIVSKVFLLLGIKVDSFETVPDLKSEALMIGKTGKDTVVRLSMVHKKILHRFDIKQPVLFAEIDWHTVSLLAANQKQAISPIPKFPAVQRDLAIVVPSHLAYEEVEKAVQKAKLNKLYGLKLFDVFESDKLGHGKKSLAVNFTFLDQEKTLTDVEIDGWMKKIMQALEKELQAEIRK